MFKVPGAQMFDWRRTLAACTADGWRAGGSTCIFLICLTVLKRVLANDPYDQESSRAAQGPPCARIKNHQMILLSLFRLAP